MPNALFSRSAHFALTAAALHSIAPGAWADPAVFRSLAYPANGPVYAAAAAVSADGAAVAGFMYDGQVWEAVRWTVPGSVTAAPAAAGLGHLPGAGRASYAFAMTPDGSTVVGYGDSNLGVQAFCWKQATGMVGLGDLPGGDFNSSAQSISADGRIAVGGGVGPTRRLESCRWWALAAPGSWGLGGMGLPGGGAWDSGATAVSGDSLTVVGYGVSATGDVGFRWTAAGGMVRLGDLPGGGPGGGPSSEPWAVSADGSVIVGIGRYDPDADGGVGVGEAFRWVRTAGGGGGGSGGVMTGLGDFSGGSVYSAAKAVSADGSVVVGSGTDAAGPKAFVWDASHGLRDLRQVLVNAGAAGLAGWRLDSANGISPGGRTVVGYGTDPSGRTQAWWARLPAPCPADVNGDDQVDGNDISEYINRLYADILAGTIVADFNGDGESNGNDISAYINAWYAAVINGGSC